MRQGRRGWEGLLLAVATLLCAGALELSFRVIMPVHALDDGAPPERFHTLRYAESPVSRHALVAAPLEVQVGWGNRYRVNGKGYRGEEFDWRKPEGTVRVVVYGGSAVFDIYQDEGDDWPARIERILTGAGAPVEVINAGVPGHATFDSVGRLLAEGHRLEPDYVLLYHAYNDFPYFSRPDSVLRQVRPLRVKESLWRPQGRLDAALAEISHVYRFLRVRFLMWDRRLGAEGRLPSGPLRDALVPEQVEQFELAVATFVDLARNAGAVPVLITQPLLARRDNTPEERALIRYEYFGLSHDALVAAHAAANAAVRRVASAKEVSLIDASTPLTGVRDYFGDCVHLSAEGSRALAELVSRELAQEIGGPRLAANLR